MSEPTIVTVRRDAASAIVRVMNTRAIVGQTCTSIIRGRLCTILTFEPTAPGEPLRVHHMAAWMNFYQPIGWDYALCDERNVYFTRTLPPGTIAETQCFDTDYTQNMAGWLTRRAANGYRLVYAWGDTYYFAPSEPAAIVYTVGQRSAEGSRIDTAALCNATEPDEDGRYFIAATSGYFIFADTPGPAPAHTEERTVPLDICRAHIRDGWKPIVRAVAGTNGILIAFLLALSFVCTLMPGFDAASRAGITAMVFMGSLLCAIMLPLLALILRGKAHKSAESLASPHDYPCFCSPRFVMPASGGLICRSDRISGKLSKTDLRLICIFAALLAVLIAIVAAILLIS